MKYSGVHCSTVNSEAVQSDGAVQTSGILLGAYYNGPKIQMSTCKW